ncbi:DUF4340 domain-containing protein [Blautia schinkii]|nr:DUF4340 domain-containing protein [Blautia schinkii]
MKETRQRICMVLIALALLGGCLWLWSDPPSGESMEKMTEALVPDDMQDEIQQITVEKEKGSYTISKGQKGYGISGIENKDVSQGVAENIFYRIIHLESVAYAQGIEEKDAGFSEPFLRLILRSNDNREIEIRIGRKSSALEGYFAKTTEKEEVYIIGTDLPEEIYSRAEGYQSMAFVDFMYESDYEQLEYLEIEGKDRIPVAFGRTEDGFRMEKPVRQLCDQNAAKNTFLHEAVHIKADEYVGNKEEPEMGFEEPEYLISMKFRGRDIKIRIGQKAGDKRYIKKDGDNAVYLIKQADLTFLETDYRLAVGESLYPRSVKDIAGVTVYAQGTKIELTEVEAKGKGYTAMNEGKRVESDLFLPFYNSIRTLELMKNISGPGKEEIKIQVTLQDGRQDEILLGYLNEREYSVSINGDCSFSTSKTSVDNLKEKIKKVRDILEL